MGKFAVIYRICHPSRPSTAPNLVIMNGPLIPLGRYIRGAALDRSVLKIADAKNTQVRLDKTMVVGGLIYGLVNVRTDGQRILCATLDEQSARWRIKTFDSRF